MTIPPKFYARNFDLPSEVQLRPIGVVRSPHQERHGTPRQAVLRSDPKERPSETAYIELSASLFSNEAVKGLEHFEYIWVIAWLHLNKGWKNQVKAPGQTTPTGLLATRAPHRPNPIGLSAVRLLEVNKLTLAVERVDLLDGTPILDVKPYVPYADAFQEAKAGWIDQRGQTPER